MGEAMKLELNNINLGYETGNDIVKNFSYIFEEGTTYLILGENGAGKSTLVKGIYGILQPSSGIIKLSDNLDYKSNVAIQMQTFESFPTMKVKEVIKLFKACIDSSEHHEELYEILLIKKIERKRISSLSGGQKMSLSIYLAFLVNKTVLILDEPLAGLDIEKKKNFIEYLNKWKVENSKIIIVISHEIKGYNNIFDKILFLDSGKFIKDFDSCEIDEAVKMLFDYKYKDGGE